MMATTVSRPNYTSSKISLSASKNARRSIDAAVCLSKYVSAFGQKLNSRRCLGHVAPPYLISNIEKMSWAVRSSDDTFDPSSSDTSNGRTRLIRVIQSFQTKLGSRIQELRKGLPLKLLFFLVGFYCATAFATVIGQTGDWDILSAALAVVVVEGIGALMYKASLRLLSKIRSLITMFNYWKAGLTLGLFLDSFKYEMDNIIGSRSPFNFEIGNFLTFL